MEYDDLAFTITDSNGNEVLCDIISVIPNPHEKDCNYVVFTDNSKDEDDNIIFLYGKLYKKDDSYELKNNVSEKELLYIKKMFGPTITKQILNELN